MENLNKGWIGLIIAGSIFMIGFMIFNFVESSMGQDSFFFSIQQFPTKQLLSEPMERHLLNFGPVDQPSF